MAAFQAPKHKSGLGQPQDEWIIREKLTLASSVQRSGDQNWVSVSRAIKPINETGSLGKVRPPDFFSQKNCAILYSQMLEKVDTPKRKRTSETGAGETPGEQIIRKLTFERIEELKKSVKNDQLTYRKLKMRMEDIRNGKMDAQLPGLWDEIQAKKRRMEEMQQLQPSGSLPTPGGDSPSIHFPGPPGINFPVAGNTGAMPGLKQSPQTTPSPHKGKQLRIPKPTPRFQKYQQQLQQRHQHGIPSGSPGDIGMTGEPTRTSIDAPRLSLEEPLKTEPMDIDPGAAVQTVSMDMPSVTPGQLATPNVEPSPSPGSTTRHLPSGNVVPQGDSLKTLLSQPAKDQGSGAQIDPAKKGSDSPQIPNAKPPQDSHTPPSSAVNQPSSKPQTTDSKSFLGNTTNPESNKLDSFRDRLSTNAGAPSVAAPTLSKLLASSSTPPNSTKTIVNSTSSNSFIDKSLSTKAIEGGINNVRSSTGMPGPGRGAIAVGGKGDGGGGGAVTAISVNPKSVLTAGTLPSPMAMTPPPTTPPAEKKEELITESVVKTIEPVPNQSERTTIEEIADTKEEPEVVEGTTEHSLPVEPKIEIVDTPQPSPRVTGRTRAPKPGRPGRPRGRRSQRRSKSVTSTDNETEVEEEKEEDNKSETMEAESEKASEKDEEDDDMESTISEKKDDSDDEDEQESIDGYSESGDRSKEESFLDRSSTIGSESVPASPASQTSQGDMDSESLQAQKTWKKSIMLVWRAAANHKYANVFLHPVTDDEAPGYHGIVFRPMDLTSIKKSIENGTIRTTSEFQRDMMLMFQNALMYNNSDHDVYRMAEEMRDDVMDQIQSYIATQLMVQSSDRDSTKMLRGHRSDVFHFFL